jgi:PAS domain S-box-containing protein
MKSEFSSKIGAAAAALLVFLMATLGWFLYQNVAQWRTSEEHIKHAQSSIRGAEDVYGAVLSAESGVRGYLITGHADLLPRINGDINDLNSKVLLLRQVEREHPEMSRNIGKLSALVEKRQALFQASILYRRTGGLDSDGLKALTEKGTALTGQVHAVVTEMQHAEREEIALWEAGEKAGTRQPNRLLNIIFICIFILLLGALAAVLRGANKRRKAEAELADEHAKLESVLDSASQVSIIAADLSGNIIFSNAGAQRMLGYTAAEMRGRTPEFIHLLPEIQERGEELSKITGKPVRGFDVFVELARQVGFENREWTYVRKDKTTFPVELVVTGMKDHAGKLTGFLGLATDISARRNAEMEMRKLSTAVKASPTSIVITDRDARIEYANPKFFKLTGYTEAELLGQNPRVISAGSTPKETYTELWATLLAGREWNGEFLNRKKNGELFWEHASISPVKDAKGTITNYIAVKLDITDQKLAQREIERMRDAAVELARMKSEFLANMSHEIRTPMNAIIGMTGLLLDTPLNPLQRDYVKTVNSAGESLLDIINDILDFSKMESGRLAIEKLDFDLNETVESTADLLAPRAQEKHIELAYLLQQDLPPALRGDQGRLRQILLNLLGNAVKFTETGEVVLTVAKEAETSESITVKFSVKDTGIGIPAEAQKNLFQVFTQADASTTRKYGGTGLGLSISKKLVELMGGRIGLESAQGKGSTFWFTLPFEKQAGTLAARPKAEVKGLKALIVDDNAANREIVSRYLEAWKMRFETASSGEGALEALKRAAAAGDPFLLVILDMQMPAMDGLMLARSIQADAALAGVKRVMMTSLGQTLEREDLSAAGISSCLTKPVRPSALLDALSSAVASRSEQETPEIKLHPAEVPKMNKYFKVLIAEDNAVNQKVAVKQLEKIGYEADVAGNGLEALQAMKHITYDLVLMDCQMPEMDGFQATTEIRKLEESQRRTPIVAMTANALQGDREKCLAAGMDGYIPKPVRTEKLAEVLAEWDTPLDAAVIKELRDLAGPENPGFLAELTGTYLADLPGRLEAIRSAVKTGNAEALQQSAHALKGSSGNIGALRLQKICLRLELIGKSGTVEGTADLLEVLEREAPVAAAAMQALGAKPGETPR